MVRVVFSYGPSCLNIRADLYSLTGRLVSVRVVRGPSCLVPVAPYSIVRQHAVACRKRNKEQKKYGRQITRADHPADTPKQFWKVSLYYAFIDHMIMELELCLIKSKNRFYAEYLLARVIGNITNEQIATLFETYQTDLTCNLD